MGAGAGVVVDGDDRVVCCGIWCRMLVLCGQSDGLQGGVRVRESKRFVGFSEMDQWIKALLGRNRW